LSDEPLPEPPDEGEEQDEQDEQAEDGDEVNPDEFNPRIGARDDWAESMAKIQEVRRRKHQEARDEQSVKGGDEEDDESWESRERSMRSQGRLMRSCLIVVALLSVAAAWQLWLYMHPKPISCDIDLIRPHKFKVDVSDFFAPKVSAALQLVLNIKNSNLLRSMLLEQCKLTAFEDSTGLKLGSTQQNSLVLTPFSSTKVTVTLQQLAGGLPQPEQRRLAADFLGKKALFLTIVATASSRIPTKGSKASEVSTNSSKRVDMSGLLKEPFFQRAQAEPKAADAAADDDKVHDVKV